AVGLGRRRSLRFADDPLPGLLVIPHRMPAAVPRPDGLRAFLVEAADQAGDRIAGASPDRVGGGLVVGPLGHGGQGLGSGGLSSRGGAGAAAAGERLLLVFGERAERVFLAACQDASCQGPGDGGRLGQAVYLMATTKANDPLGPDRAGAGGTG